MHDHQIGGARYFNLELAVANSKNYLESTLLHAESRGVHREGGLRGSRWQGEVERRAASLVRCCPNTPTTRLNDRLADRKAHAAALRLRRKECVEYLVGLAHGQPGTCVMNRNMDLAVYAQLRLQR